MMSPQIPILQAPIGGSTCPELAAAVSNAGAMGSLALTWSTPEEARRAIQRTKELTEKPFFVNFALAFEPLALEEAVQSGVAMVTFSFGDPGRLVERVRSAGSLLGIQVGSADAIGMGLRYEPDVLIVQGEEAGGHVQGVSSIWDLLPLAIDIAGDCPVYAAGGIATGQEMAKAMRLGAAGVMMGTRFVATRESRAHAAYKQSLVEAGAVDSVLTTCFSDGWPGAPHRVLRNGTVLAWENAGCPGGNSRPGEGEVLARYPDGEAIHRYSMNQPTAGVEGDIGELCLYAGTSVGAIEDVPGAGDVIRRLWLECAGCLGPTGA